MGVVGRCGRGAAFGGLPPDLDVHVRLVDKVSALLTIYNELSIVPL
jgi:hypothetical protein